MIFSPKKFEPQEFYCYLSDELLIFFIKNDTSARVIGRSIFIGAEKKQLKLNINIV